MTATFSAHQAGDDVVWCATTLGWVNDGLAQDYLQRLLMVGRPILRAHKWRIAHLKEFYPRSARLLGQNVAKGEEVRVRFRTPMNKDTFFPFHEVLCTFLHELAHCEFSAHNQRFWELYTALSVECCELRMNISSGKAYEDHFHNAGRGRRLGGDPNIVPENNATTLRYMLEDDTRRRRQLCESGRGCGCAHRASTAEEAPTEGSWICHKCGNVNGASYSDCGFCMDVGTEGSEEEEWVCGRCCFHNCRAVQQCEACGRPNFQGNVEQTHTICNVKAMNGWPNFLSFTLTLGRLADALATVLGEMGQSVMCLEEFAPLARSVMSKSTCKDGNPCHTISIRLRSPNNVREHLPLSCIVASVLHQLAHVTERNHGVGFVHTWINMIYRFLSPNNTLSDELINSQDREDLGNFARELELPSCELRERDYEQHTRFSSCAPFAQLLFEVCSTPVKREWSPTAAGSLQSKMVAHDRRFVFWQCERCSVVNDNGSVLFCEVCGGPRQLLALLGPRLATNTTVPRNENVIDISDEEENSERSVKRVTTSPEVTVISD